MKNFVRLIFLSVLLHATASLATPTLSPDGSRLTGLDVGGMLYDVTFGNGVAGSVYAGVTFDEARKVEANAVSEAIATFLRDKDIYAPTISGCDHMTDGFSVCEVFNPEEVIIRPGTSEILAYFDLDSIIGIDYSWGLALDRTRPARYNSGNWVRETLATYAQARTVPVPGGLFALGLLVLAARRRQQFAGLQLE